MSDTKELIERIESEIPHARVKRLGFVEIHVDTLEEIIEILQSRKPTVTIKDIDQLVEIVGEFDSLDDGYESIGIWLKSIGVEVKEGS